MISSVDDELMCSVLRGAPTAWPASACATFQEDFLRRARYQGVEPLLSANLRSSDMCDGWPLGVRAALSREAASHAAVAMLQKREITRVLRALTTAAVTPLLMKGTPLAYAMYRSPDLRPHADTDILIRRGEREATERTLADLRYERVNATSGGLVSSEFAMTRLDRFDVTHTVDVHWRVSNRQRFAEALPYHECQAGSVAVPQLGARALGPMHALLLACMHRVTHVTVAYQSDGESHYGDRLIWLCDIHLLASALSTEAFRRFVQLAADKRLRRICWDGLTQAQRCFGTRLQDDVLEALSAPGPPEPSARDLEPGRLRCMVRDIRSLPSWRDRLRLGKEHIFPPADYVLKKYGVSSPVWLPALYLHRGLWGALKLLRGSDRFSPELATDGLLFRSLRHGMAVVRRFTGLSFSRQRLLLATVILVAAVRLLLWLLPSARLSWLAKRMALHSASATSPAGPHEARATVDNIAWAVTIAARYVPRATCLTQALTAQWLLTRSGCATHLRIGVAKGNDNVLKAHAWLECGGRVVVGGEWHEEYVAFPPLNAPAARNGRR